MNKLKFSYFKINFNSYYPYAYEIQKGNYIHYLPNNKLNDNTNSLKNINKTNDKTFKSNKIKIKSKKLSTNINN